MPGTVLLMQSILLGQRKVMQIRQRETLSHQRAIIHEVCLSSAQLSNFQNDSNPQDPQVWYTTKQNTTVYAIVIGWPLSDAPLELGSVKSTNQTQISVLGLNQNVESFEQTKTGLKVQLPAFSKLYQACYSCQWATVLKMTSVVPVALKTNAPKIEVL